MKPKLDYLILKDKKLILEYYRGKYNVDELIAFKIRVGNDIEYNPNFDIIHDFRDLIFDLEVEEVEKYIKLLTENKKYVGERRSAMVTQTPNQVMASFGFELLKNDLPVSVKVSSTLETALTFLDIPSNEWEQIENILSILKTRF